MTDTDVSDQVLQPLASVIVLTYNRPKQLARCLRSLSAQQFHGQFEIVVADDGSASDTARVITGAQADDSRIRHVRDEHHGIPATRNLGVAAARGRYIAIVADDYVLAPHYLATAVDYLERRPEAAVVRFNITPLHNTRGSRISQCYYGASISRRLESEGLTDDDLRSGVATTTLEAAGAAVFRSEVLANIGPWDERLQRGEDTEQSARLRAAGYQVHILAAHTVQVDFNRVPIDTLRKCFLTGVWRHRTTPPPLPIPNERNASVPRRAMRRLRRVSRSWMAADRARRGGSSWRSFAWYLPWMTLFETAVRAGALWSSLTAPRGLASTSRAATEAPVRQ